MIMIALADGNPTYCQGLKTLLEQVEDFRVLVMPPENFCLQLANGSDILQGPEVLYKGSGKREFEERIRKLALADINSINI